MVQRLNVKLNKSINIPITLTDSFILILNLLISIYNLYSYIFIIKIFDLNIIEYWRESQMGNKNSLVIDYGLAVLELGN